LRIQNTRMMGLWKNHHNQNRECVHFSKLPNNITTTKRIAETSNERRYKSQQKKVWIPGLQRLKCYVNHDLLLATEVAKDSSTHLDTILYVRTLFKIHNYSKHFQSAAAYTRHFEYRTTYIEMNRIELPLFYY
jgi:hypothetical protein